jgi:UDP-GlcNAc:undecaprenyl-phosphate GlcNAc-1-phosphate transferase
MRGFYAGTGILGIIGFLDDFRELGHQWKFIAQIFSSLFMIYLSDTTLYTFGDLFSLGAIYLGKYTIPVTVFCVVGVINAINMSDGLDGLAGGISFIAFISFAVLSYLNDQAELTLLSLALSGAVLAFLRYNWYPSSLFMGDAGSLFLGFSLAFLSIAVAQKIGGIVSPVAPLLILTVPIVDTITVMLQRTLKGRNPFYADRYHLHHIFLRFGFDKKRTVQVILLISSLLSVTAIAGTVLRIPDYYLFLIFSVYFVAYLISSFHIKEILRFIKKRKKVYFKGT